jgi:hypothetical protein
MPRSLPPVHFTDAQDAELSEYRYLPGQVVVAIILGLLSPLALVDPWLMCVPVLGVFFGVWAIRRVRQNASAMTGRKRAIFGLALSLIFLVAAPTDAIASYRLINQQAREIADAWFRLVLEKRLPEARRLMLIVKKENKQETPQHSPVAMAAMNERAKHNAPGKSEFDQEVEEFSKGPLVETLMSLGPAARVRFFQTHQQQHIDSSDVVQLVYAVTYDDGGERKSFFVCADVRRIKLSSDQFDWRIMNVYGGFRPDGW